MADVEWTTGTIAWDITPPGLASGSGTLHYQGKDYLIDVWGFEVGPGVTGLTYIKFAGTPEQLAGTSTSFSASLGLGLGLSFGAGGNARIAEVGVGMSLSYTWTTVFDLPSPLVDFQSHLTDLDNYLANTSQWTLTGNAVTVADLLACVNQYEAVNYVVLHMGATEEWDGNTHIMQEISEKLDTLQNLYNANKSDIDQISPGFGDFLGDLVDASSNLAGAAEAWTPLMLDLDRDGIETIAMKDSEAHFDFGDDGAVKHGWVGPDDGLLALDRNGNNIIDDSSELFGSKELDGFSILKALDVNNDGVLDQSDDEFGSLLIWQDANSDGVSQQEELYGLDAFGLDSISLNSHAVNTYSNGNWTAISSTITFEDGSESEISDVYFQGVTTSPLSGDHQQIASSASRVNLGTQTTDVLTGDASDQVFRGLLGDDVFIFSGETGRDIISDFFAYDGRGDIISFDAYLFSSFEEVASSMTQCGDDTIIDIDEGNSIRLSNVEASTLSSNDFLFV